MTTKGMTYFCTDSHGNLYTRYSERHNKALYPYAVVTRKAGTTEAVRKNDINYAGRYDLAVGQQRAATRNNGKDFGYGVIDYTAEIVGVRAYPGRHKVEPQA